MICSDRVINGDDVMILTPYVKIMLSNSKVLNSREIEPSKRLKGFFIGCTEKCLYMNQETTFHKTKNKNFDEQKSEKILLGIKLLIYNNLLEEAKKNDMYEVKNLEELADDMVKEWIDLMVSTDCSLLKLA